MNTEHTSYDSVFTFGLLEEGNRITEKPEILFARLNEKEVMEKVNAIQDEQKKAAKKAQETKPVIEIGDFEKLDLRVGKVVSCQKHPSADKLLVLQVDLGEESPRQIVSGLAQCYTPGQVIGKNVVVIANLKSTTLRGVESNGMLLAGKQGKDIELVEVNGLEPGCRIS